MEFEELAESNIREQMLGLLPFDNEAMDEYIPKDYMKLPEKYRPVFVLKPWSQSEKEKTQLIIEKLENLKDTKSKIQINKELNEMSRKKIFDIKNLFDVGKNTLIDTSEFRDNDCNCINQKLWQMIPDTIKTTLYFRIATISGLVKNEILGL